MAQTDVVLNTGIAENILLMRGEAASAWTKIVGLNMATVCTAVVGSTFADPADTAAHHTDGGLAIQAIDTVGGTTVNTAGDTITFDTVLTATETRNLAGIQICNDDGDASLIESCFASVLPMSNTDTCTIDGQSTLDQA